jgi:hypothetical protein
MRWLVGEQLPCFSPRREMGGNMASRIQRLADAFEHVARLAEDYAKPHDREMAIDPMVYAYLAATFKNVERQHYVYWYKSQKPKRIDFRLGGTAPIVVEFACRPPAGGAQLTGPVNQSELRKLCRVTKTSASLRALVLMDLAASPISKELLKATYDKVNSGPGKFHRHSVRVIYVHRDLQYHFVWRPLG